MRAHVLWRLRWAVLVSSVLLLVACGAPSVWSDGEIATLRALSIEQLPPLPPDPSNRVADDPRAVELGRALFFDPRLSGNGALSCASCHEPERAYTDGKPLAEGMATFPRHTMTLLGSAYAPWLTWDGKADSQWMQALLPLENSAEQGIDRTALAHQVAAHYADLYTALFGPLPPLADQTRFPAHAGPRGDDAARAAWATMAAVDRDALNRIFANLGKAIAAWERTLLPAPARFDAYVHAVATGDRAAQRALYSEEEVAGLRLFLGKAHCIDCHNGPLFTNFEFHNTAVPPVAGLPIDRGRAAALEELTAGEFNCLGPYSDAPPAACSGLRFLVSEGETLEGGFRTPTLRNVAITAPYMHRGQIATVEDVLRHYNEGGLQLVGHNELTPLGLSDAEMEALAAFLRTLTQEEMP